MAKYNIREKKVKPATYRTAIKPELIDSIYEQKLRKMIVVQSSGRILMYQKMLRR